MSAFLRATNRMMMNYGADVNLSKEEKKEHTFRVLRDWLSATEQLRLGNIYNSELGICLGDKLWNNQQYSALNVYKKLGEQSGAVLEEILEWDGSFDEFSNAISTHIPYFHSINLETIEEALIVSAKEHHSKNKHRSIMKILDHQTPSDISGKQDVQLLSPEYNITTPKYAAMKMDDFLDLYPLPTNLKEVECKSFGRTFHFLHSLHPETLKSEITDSLNCANSFWKVPDISVQLTKFFDNWASDRKFNSRYHLGFVDCLLELMWIRDRMLAAKNMNANKQTIFWENICLKNKANVKWLLTWCRRRPTIFLNIIKGTIQQLTENNESKFVILSLGDFMELEFKSWLCICEHEYLKLVQVTLFEKVIDHNLIFDHDVFACQELINSGMMVIFLAIMKSFVDDRNSFIIEERRNLNFTVNTGFDLVDDNEKKLRNSQR